MSDVSKPASSEDAQILQAAAEWFAALSDDADEAQRRQWQAWMDADARHRDAWARVEALSRKFGALPDSADKEAAMRALFAVRGRRRTFKMIAVTAGLSAIPLGYMVREAGREFDNDGRTAVGEQREINLADGTTVWLNTGSAVRVHFDETARTLELVEGEILVETAIDPQVPPRPFAVVLPEGRVTPLGTRFNLYRDGGGCRVSVFAGKVEVRAGEEAETAQIAAGQELRFNAGRIGPLRPADEARRAWTRGLLVADNMRLDDFMAELSRYQAGHFSCASEVAGLRLLGTFPLADKEGIYEALERSLPVRVSRPLPWWVSVGPR